MNAVAALAVTLKFAASPDFKRYADQVLKNSKALANVFINSDTKLVTGGTDNHMLVLDTVQSYGIDGRIAEETLDKVNITTNKQIIPDDPNPPLRPSGIRIGTPAATSRGMLEADMERLGAWIDKCLRAPNDKACLHKVKKRSRRLLSKVPCSGFGFFKLQEVIEFLLHRFGDRASINSHVRQLHGQDESFHKSAQPDIVVFPKNTNEVSEIVVICAKHKVPIVPFGAGTSLEGHIAAVRGGVCIDLSQMNKVLEIYSSDMDVHIEAGITRKTLNKQLQPYGLFFG